MNPVVEQHNNNFLMYIKNKFKVTVSAWKNSVNASVGGWECL